MRSFVLLFSSGVVVLALACGGKTTGDIGDGGAGSSSGASSSGASSGSGSSSGGPFDQCLQTSGSPPACVTCIETQCASQLAAVESGCKDLLQCECPGGVFNQSAAQACASMEQEPSCVGPVDAIGQCESQHCLSACQQIASSSSGGSSSGVSSSGAGSGGSSSSGGPPPPGCTVDSTVACGSGAFGFACAAGDNPELADPSLSCSTPTASGSEDLYCCFSGAWSSTTCMPDDTLTSVCPDPTTYGFVCVSGEDPTTFDARLNCSTPTPDADGVHDDFCCVYE